MLYCVMISKEDREIETLAVFDRHCACMTPKAPAQRENSGK